MKPRAPALIAIKHKLNTQLVRGYTLAELLLAAAILAFVLTGLLSLFINCILLNVTSHDLSLATSHAQYILEGIKHTLSFADIQVDINNGAWDWGVSDITDANLTPLSAETINTDVSGSNPLDVTVTVTWNEFSGATRSTQLRTLITDTQ